MVRPKGNQRPVTDRQESGYDKAIKRKKKQEEDEKLAGSLTKYFQTSTSVGESSSAPEESGSPTKSDPDPAIIVIEPNLQNLDAAIPMIISSCGSGNEDINNEINDIQEQVDLSDPSTWNFPINENTRRFIVLKGPVQKRLSVYPKKGSRCFSNDHYRRSGSNENEGQLRNWLLYSEKTNSLFCFPCCLFSRRSESSPWSNFGDKEEGFSDFIHQTRAVLAHEQSQQHFNSVIAWKEYLRISSDKHSLNSKLRDEYQQETSFWRKVLRSLLDAVLFLARNNLAFRGSNEKIGSPNCGNFLGLVELLSHYHPPLALHIERLQKRSTSYMSPQIQNEFICLAARNVRSSILEKIRERKFYSILFDATPDCSHKEQISQVIRTVNVSKFGCTIEENFIDFLHFEGKKGEQISNAISEKLNHDGIDISYCRGQGYDNGANMSGVYNGVQAHIKQKNELADFIPCAAHSLNLVGQNAVAKILPGKLILGQVQTLYNFFSSSTQRWNILKKHAKKTLKSQSQTRWSSKADAVNTLFEDFSEILDALVELMNSENTNSQTLADATSIYHQISNFRFLLGITIWNFILSRINVANKALQSRTMDLDQATKHLGGLLDWLQEFHEEGFNICIVKARAIASKNQISEDSGFDYRLTRNRLPARFRNPEEEPNVISEPKTNIKKFEEDFFDRILERLLEEFKGRFEIIRKTNTEFSFLWGETLANAPNSELEKACKDLAMRYCTDLDATLFVREINFLKSAISPFLGASQSMESTGAMEILNILTMNDLTDQFINCHTSLRIYLTMPVTVAENERSFSKLKIIKNYLRSSMGQERLSDLAILSIEIKETTSISFDSLIDDFAAEKCRRLRF